jgi:hypothetical protein
MTVAEFRQMIWKHLSTLPPEDEIFFGQGDLSFYRVKTRGDHLHQIEFNQVYTVDIDPDEG